MPESANAASGEPSQDARLDAARVAALFDISRPAYLASLVVAALLLLILVGTQPLGALLAWFGALAVVQLSRLALDRRFRRVRPEPIRSKLWERRFVVGALAMGGVWAAAVLAFLPRQVSLEQLALLLVIAGAIVSGAGLYAASQRAAYAMGLPPLLCVAAQFALQPWPAGPLLVLVVVAFGAMMARVSLAIRRGIVESLRVRLQNEQLLNRIAASEERLRDAMESLSEGIAIWDIEDRLVACNETYARIYGAGLSPERLPGTPFRAVAENAFEAERIGPEFAGRREEWVGQRVALHRAASGEMTEFRRATGAGGAGARCACNAAAGSAWSPT